MLKSNQSLEFGRKGNQRDFEHGWQAAGLSATQTAARLMRFSHATISEIDRETKNSFLGPFLYVGKIFLLRICGFWLPQLVIPLFVFFFYVNAAWPHNSFTRTPGCLLLHQNFTFINNILSSSTNLYAGFCLFHFHLLFDYITANASKTSKPFSKINSRTATSTPEPPPTWAVLAAATPPDNHAAPLVSCWCFLCRRAPADAAWIFFSTLLREEGPPPPSPSRPAGWPSLVLLSLVRCLYETPSSLKWFWTWIFLFFWHMPLLLTPTRLL